MSSSLSSIWFPCIAIGLAAGVASGLFGVGGGIVIVPLLVFWFGYSIQTASGTSLVALVLPVGSFAILNYWRAGKIDGQHIEVGLLIGLGIAVGALAGSQLAIGISEEHLKKAFALLLASLAVKLWISG